MKIEHQEGKKLFALFSDEGERMGYITYENADEGFISATHTKVYPAYEGHGHAARLLDALADWARGQGLKIYPACPYVKKMFERYTEKYADVMA